MILKIFEYTAQTNLMKYGEVDHYFPKKSYPALIFHPINLAAICGECDDFKVKGEKNPLEKSNLIDLYIPYLGDTEKETELGVRQTEEGKDGEWTKVKKIVMIPRGSDANGLITRRIRNLDHLFDLSSCWTERMQTFIEDEFKYLKDEKREFKVKRRLRNKVRERTGQAEKAFWQNGECGRKRVMS